MSVGRLHLCIVEAELHALDTEEEKNFNAYCLVSVAQDKQKVAVAPSTLKPSWNHNLVLKVNTLDASCMIAVWNQFRYWTDELLGGVRIKLSKYRNGLPKERWFRLSSVQEYEHIQVQLGESSLLGSLGLGKAQDPIKLTTSRGRIRLKVMFEATEMYYIPPTPLTRKQQQRQAVNDAKGKDFIPDASSDEEEEVEEAVPAVLASNGKAAKSVTIHSKSIDSSPENMAVNELLNELAVPSQEPTATSTATATAASAAVAEQPKPRPNPVKKKIPKREADIEEGEKKAIPVIERADQRVKVPFPWGYVITSEDMCISVDGADAVAAQKVSRELELEKENAQLLAAQYQDKIKDKTSQLRLVKAEFKKMQQTHQELTDELTQVKADLEASREREAKASAELADTRLLVESLRDELGQVRKLEQTLHDVENEKQRLETQLSTKETSLAQSQEETKRLKTEQINIQKTGFEPRIKGLFKLDKDETLLNQHPCANGIVYVFVDSLCIDLYLPTQDDNVSQHKRLAIPYGAIKGIKRRKFIKFVKGQPGGLTILFGAGKPPIKLEGFVDREACARDIISMCGSKGVQVLEV